MLTAGFSIPGCLKDAEQLKKEHEQFQTAIEVGKASVATVTGVANPCWLPLKRHASLLR